MKYISIDIETTGLNPEKHQILEIGAIIEDTKKLLPREKCPQFHVYLSYEDYVGEAFALQLNHNILKTIHNLRVQEHSIGLVRPDRVSELLGDFIFSNLAGEGSITPAGKNFSAFDLQFLKRLNGFNTVPLARRSLDPSAFYLDFQMDDSLPSLSTCKKRAGLSELVTHQALDDAWDVIELLRPQYQE